MPQTPASNPLTEAIQGFVLKNITRTGVVGAGLYAAATLGRAVIHRSWDEAFTACGYVGLTLIVSGAAFRAKKTSDILVGSEAEKRIADPAMTGTSPTVPQSSVPAIQKAIEKATGTGDGTKAD